jgi:outer membrane receptor for ferrienterochelin and colicins
MQLARHPQRLCCSDSAVDLPPQWRTCGMTGTLWVALAIGASATAHADDAGIDDAAAVPDGEVIVVTGTRAEAPRAASPVITEVIDRQRLEASGVQTVSEALAMRPGLFIDRGVAGTTGLTIQGLGPQYSMILVDGARQIGRTDGYLDLDRFGVADLEQIEIVRGPTSALYGADALGGVVNLITRKPAPGFAVDLAGRLDGRRASEARARITAGRDDLAATVSGELRDAPAIRRDRTTAATTIDAYQDRHLSGRATSPRGDHWRLDGSADYLYRDLRGVDAEATGATFDRRNLVETASGRLGARYASDRTAAQLSADASVYRDQYLHDQQRSDALDRYEVTDERLVEGAAQLAHQLGEHRVTGGGELLHEALDADRLSAPGSRTRGAVYAQDEWRLGGDGQLIVLPAARVDLDSQFGTHATPRLAARWQVAPALVVRGSAGAGYRAPSFKELLLHFENPSVGYVVDGNPALSPETSRSAQAGLEWQVRPSLWLSASGFYNGLHDLIAAITEPDDGSGTLRFRYGNIGRARTAGLETSAMVSRGRLGVELGYALTRTRDLDQDRPLEGVPAQRVTATVRWRDAAEGLDAFAAAVVTGHRPFYLADDPQMATLSGRRTELRARVAKRFASGLGGFLGVDNLLDAGDATLDRIPPRTFYAGLELHL